MDLKLYDLGVDISREWAFQDGDIKLTYYDENIKQAVYNRLTCWLDSMKIFYINYGSELSKYLGEKNKHTTHEYIRLEIEKRLNYDPRIKDASVKITKTNSYGVDANITLTFKNGETYEDNFVIKTGEKEVNG